MIEGESSPVRLGHYAKILTEIDRLKNDGMPTLTLDAGDFFAGTIYHSLASDSSNAIFPEWEFFKRAGYDAVILGNHEFDAGNNGFQKMLAKITDGPALLSTNISLPVHLKNNKIVSEVIKTLTYKDQSLSVGILGILGPDGCLVSKSSREEISFIGFDDASSNQRWDELIGLLKEKIKVLKDKTDMIILVMHAGHPEDEKLANALDGIDFIIAGHTHKIYAEKINNIPISQAGDFGSHLGAIDLVIHKTKKTIEIKTPFNQWHRRIRDQEYDEPFLKRINSFKLEARKHFSSTLPNFNKVIYTPTKTMLRSREVHNELGRFITSGIRESINKVSKDKVDIYFTSMGLIRASLFKDKTYTFPDLFEILSIGFDRNGKPGPELSVFKLTTNDLVKVISFMELYSHFSNSFAPAFSSSLEFKVRKYGIPFVNRIYDIKVGGVDLDDIHHHITVATNMIVAKNIDLVSSKTYGLIKLDPLNLEGQSQSPKESYLPKEFELLTKYLMGRKD